LGTYTDNDLVLLGPNLPHTWASDKFHGEKFDMHEGIVTQFLPDFLGREFFEAGEMHAIGELLKRSQRGLWYPATFAVEIGKRLNRMTTLTGARRLLELLECLDELSRFPEPRELASAGYVGPTNSTSESRMQIIYDFTQQNFTDATLNAGLLAKRLDMNASAFCRFFKQSTGLTPSSFINELRIGYACRQLLDSDRSVLKVCYDSGFASTSHFNETFRKLRGMSPRKYRLRHASLHSRDSKPRPRTPVHNAQEY
jgi:AraC-like DNA-binding protein